MERELQSATAESETHALPTLRPATHGLGTGDDPASDGWSQLGRRVLAEAWRRTTEEFATLRRAAVSPVVPAPGVETEA